MIEMTDKSSFLNYHTGGDSHAPELYSVRERERENLPLLKHSGLQWRGEAAQQWDFLQTEDTNRCWTVRVI